MYLASILKLRAVERLSKKAKILEVLKAGFLQAKVATLLRRYIKVWLIASIRIFLKPLFPYIALTSEFRLHRWRC